jgi:mevalonate kinase
MALSTSAPAKVILFGEHAVVYKQPALAVPVSSLRVTATIEPSDQFQVIASDIEREITSETLETQFEDALSKMVRLVLKHFDAAPPNSRIELHSEIPVASGLGSGAAVSAALGRALALALQLELSDTELNGMVYEVEQMHHTYPSGIDNTVIVYEQPVYFIRDTTLQTFEVSQPIRVLIADTGVTAPTAAAVEDVRKLFNQSPAETQFIFDAIGNTVQRAKQALESADIRALGELALLNHELLQKLTVSSPELDQLVGVAVQAGAHGAKLSGGGRGGNMIVFADEAQLPAIRDALLQAGAVRVTETVIQ